MKPSKINLAIINCSFRKCIGVMFLLVLLGIFLIKVKFRSRNKTANLTSFLKNIFIAVKVDLRNNFFILLFYKK